MSLGLIFGQGNEITIFRRFLIKERQTIMARLWNIRIVLQFSVFTIILFHKVHAQCSATDKTATENINSTFSMQTITNPGEHTYLPSLNCKWIIDSGSSGDRILLTLKYYYIEAGPGCSYDSLKILDGNTLTSTVLATLCGNQQDATETYTSSGRYLMLNFKSDFSVEYGGFEATYNSGTDQVWNWMFSPGGTTCKYVGCWISIFSRISWGCNVPTPQGLFWHRSVVDERFSHLNRLLLLASENCIFHIVAFTTPAPPVITQAPNVESGCGTHTLTASSAVQYLTSPSYPIFYTNNLDCSWLISAPTGYDIQINFQDFFTELSDGCTTDVLIIYDGDTTEFPVIGRFCGEYFADVNSTSNKLLLTFTTDESYTERGFELTFAIHLPCVDESVTTTNLNASSTIQYITSPGYPSNYANLFKAQWLIYNPTEDNDIILKVEDSRIEAVKHCIYDKVEVYKGPCTSYPLLAPTSLPLALIIGLIVGPILTIIILIAVICFIVKAHRTYKKKQKIARIADSKLSSGEPQPGSSTSYASTLKLPPVPVKLPPIDADLLYNTKNLKLPPIPIIAQQCSATDKSATENLNSTYSMQIITNPGEHTYLPILNCKWIIDSGDPNERILITLNYYYIEAGPGCSYDSLKILDAGDGCSETEELNVTMPDVGYISSPGFPTTVTPGAACSWIIRPSDSTDSTGTLLASYCAGRKTINSVQTTFVGFREIFISYSGFTTPAPPVVTQAPNVESECGTNTLTASTAVQYLTSPSYPVFYSNNLDCSWLISAPTGYDIQINFQDFFTELSDGCTTDVLVIYDGNTTKFPVIGRFCGETFADVNSTSNKLLLTFTTDESYTERGFELTFVAIERGIPACVDETVTTTFLNVSNTIQYITSPGYPSNYTRLYKAQWLIYNPTEDNDIIIKVEDSRIEAVKHCIYDKVEVYKGPCTSYPLLGRFCGVSEPTYYQDAGTYVLIVFTTDINVQFRGFNISYVLGDAPTSLPLLLIIGLIVGPILAIIILIAVICCIVKACRIYKRKQKKAKIADSKEPQPGTSTSDSPTYQLPPEIDTSVELPPIDADLLYNTKNLKLPPIPSKSKSGKYTKLKNKD
ncbi:hypothetical protein KUTeg_024981 [Tegillarca granosa]|uniref:CUB domain-containing protein n=1 Tax=Tegillarca granosa TaxID=220873 RepID=A0ABQ9E4L9_TEGGR|nr:hypothetical protein KUTeg_024981 [Tegillarca granosa]